jgi:hypothetical protein
MKREINKMEYRLPKYTLDSRLIMDKRRPHLVDVYYNQNNCGIRIATYSGKTKTLTFYPNNWNEKDNFNIHQISEECENVIKKHKENK